MSTPADEAIVHRLLSTSAQQAYQNKGRLQNAHREDKAWDRVEELNEECDQLAEENRKLREQLSGRGNQNEARLAQANNEQLAKENHELKQQLTRSRALNKLTMIQSKGLLDTIKHLKKNWDPSDASESSYKEKMAPLVDKNIEKVKSNPEVVKKIEEDIENEVNPKRRVKKTPGP